MSWMKVILVFSVRKYNNLVIINNDRIFTDQKKSHPCSQKGTQDRSPRLKSCSNCSHLHVTFVPRLLHYKNPCSDNQFQHLSLSPVSCHTEFFHCAYPCSSLMHFTWILSHTFDSCIKELLLFCEIKYEKLDGLMKDFITYEAGNSITKCKTSRITLFSG